MSPSEAASEATDLAELRAAAAQCTGCDLYKGATQTVFGAGPDDARLLFVGEQPGDTEDREGEPFVGPAGKLLDRALDDAAIVREDAYVTNLVKHFKFTRRGKRRIHQRPDSTQIAACRPWLDKEIALIEPDVVVALGATAAKALLGSSFRVTQQRGEIVERDEARYSATVHPSSIVRLDDEERRAAYADLVEDLQGFAELLHR